MKSFKSLLLIFCITLLASCASTTFYQVYETEASDELTKTDHSMVYEDENCRVLYNLWGDGGNIGFQFYNKTDEPIFLHLNQSFFILNDVAYDYYRDRVITYSNSSGIAASSSTYSGTSETGFNLLNLLQTSQALNSGMIGSKASSGQSVSYQEEEIVVIPSHASKVIAEYTINESVIRNCDLLLYPNRKEINTVTYSPSNTPLEFSNRITYSIGQNPNLNEFENQFYVSGISNYPEKEFTVQEFDEFCGEKSAIKSKYFKNKAPDQFYIKYSREYNGSRNH